MSKLNLIKKLTNQSAIDCAEALLERCKNGETIGITIVEEIVGNYYKISGSSTSSSTSMAGMLLSAAIDRLK